MKLIIKAQVIDDDGDEIVTEEVVYAGNKSGVVHAVKAMGDSITYAVSLGLFYKKQISVKDALGNSRAIAKDVIELTDAKKEAAQTKP